jgi:hypothetical protein
VTDLDEASPPTVRADESLTLQAAIADGSVETYVPPLGGMPVPEALQTSWFSTAGRFSRERTDNTEEPTTVLELRETLPAAGAVIDLYAVTRDGRGGVTYVHRALAFGQ